MTQASASASRPTLSRDVQLKMIASASAASVTAPRLMRPSSGARAGAIRPQTPCFDGDWHERDHDHADDREAEVLLDDRLIAEEVTKQAEAPDPEDTAADVEREETRIVHAPNSRDERSERAHDRYETSEHDRLAAVPFVKVLSAQQVLALEPAAVLRKHARPDCAADEVVRVVANDRRRREQGEHADDIDDAGCGERAHGKKQRVAGEKRRHDDAGL